MSNVKSVLIIGGAGYIGSALLDVLLSKTDYEISLFDLFLFGYSPIQFATSSPNPRLKIICDDFRDKDKLVKALEGVDVVIHLGGIVGDAACNLNENITIEINELATQTIVDAATEQNVKHIIYASTCSVYGASDDNVSDEFSSLSPLSLYAKTKMASEIILLQSGQKPASPKVTILRFATVYGLSGRIRFDLVVNTLTATALVDKTIRIFGGDQWRPFIHVHDVAMVLQKITEAPLDIVGNQIFNVGSNDQNYTIEDVGAIINSLIPEAELVLMDTRVDPRSYRVKFDKLWNTLNFSFAWNIERGVMQVTDFMLCNGLTNYGSDMYSNVKLTQRLLSKLGSHSAIELTTNCLS